MGQLLDKDALDREKTGGEGLVVRAGSRRRSIGPGREKEEKEGKGW